MRVRDWASGVERPVSRDELVDPEVDPGHVFDQRRGADGRHRRDQDIRDPVCEPPVGPAQPQRGRPSTNPTHVLALPRQLHELGPSGQPHPQQRAADRQHDRPR